MMEIPVVQLNQEWSMDMSYLTPAYMANFRPAYKERLKNAARKKHSESKTARRR